MAESNSPIANNLKKYRRIIGYSQKEVAKILGFKSTSRISLWEKGKAMPSIENILKLSALYSTLPNELYYNQWQLAKLSVQKNKESSP